MSGREISLAASNLCDKDDDTLLTHAELAASWGGPIEFMHSHGLYPHEQEDLDDAVALSRAYKEADDYCDETDEDDEQGSNQDNADLVQEGQEEYEMGLIGAAEEYCPSLHISYDDAYSSDGDDGAYSPYDDAYSSE
jgi:hypothetical protein